MWNLRPKWHENRPGRRFWGLGLPALDPKFFFVGCVLRTRNGGQCPPCISMKKDDSEEMRPEYRREDLGAGVRGKYLTSFLRGT